MPATSYILLIATSLLVATSRANPGQWNYTSSNDTYHYETDDITLAVQLIGQKTFINITCEGPNTSCSGLPSFKLNSSSEISEEAVLTVFDCSPKILECMEMVFPNVTFFVILHRPQEPMMYEGDTNIAVVKLIIHLADNATEIPYALINEIGQYLEQLILTGTSSQLTANICPDLQFLSSLYLVSGGYTIDEFPSKNGTVNLRKLESTGDNNISINSSDSTDEATISTILANCSFVSLRKLFISGWNLKLTADAFTSVPKLSELTLISNNLTNIPSGCFNGLVDLIKIHIAMNNLEDIEPGAFVDLIDVDIRLQGMVNAIYWNLRLHDDTERGVYMRDLSLREMRSEVLYKQMYTETLLIIDNKVNMHLNINIFKDLSHLKIVVFTNNGIDYLPYHIFFECQNLKEIIIDRNNIIQLNPSLFSGLINLIHINLSHNKIKSISEDIFKDLHKLQVLDLSHNELTTLDGLYSIPETNALTILKLSYNHITSVMVNPLKLIKYGNDLRIGNKTAPLKTMSNLNILDLSFNKIDSFYKDWQLELLNIIYIDLTGNLFTDIEDFKVDCSESEVTIDLTNNRITNILLDPLSSHTNDTKRSKSFMILNRNPINIDCNSYGLYLRLQGFKNPQEPNYIMNQMITGENVTDISTNLTCDLAKECPNYCTTCVAKAITNEMIIICDHMPPTLPDLTDYDFYYQHFEEPIFLTVQLNKQPQSITNINIHTLNLSYAGIHDLIFEPTESLHRLDLSYNNLTRIPDKFLNTNLSLYLSNNPLECDCIFLKKIRDYKLIVDFDKMTCENGDIIAQIDMYERCYKREAAVALLGSILAILICVVLVGKALYAHRKDIRNCVARILRIPQPTATEILQMKLEAEKQYDFFVSFAYEDTEFVTENLLPRLENDFNQKVCVHFRDWIAGELISDQIIKSVESSRRTVIILTEAFLSSEWSYLEFRTARNLSIQEGTPRVLIILLNEDIVNSDKLKYGMKAYLADNTYLLWTDPNFWDKLKNLLPSQGGKHKKKK